MKDDDTKCFVHENIHILQTYIWASGKLKITYEPSGIFNVKDYRAQ